MDDEEKDKTDGEVSEDAIGEVLDETESGEEADPLMEPSGEDEYRERDWA